jgi:hypothetical protein
MKKLLLVVLFLYGFVAISNGATYISGNIDGVVFDVSKNPYIVEKDVIVPKGKSVAIPEGVILLFHPFTGFQVFGRLVVQGSGEHMVVFTSINDNLYNPESEQLPNPFDWNGVFISKDADGAFLNHFTLKYSVYGVKSQCKNIIIQNAVFQQNGQFHFTINEQIQLVQDNIPFSYGDSSNVENGSGSGKGGSTGGTITGATKPGKDDNQSKGNSVGVKVFRYVALGVGIAGGVTAIVYGMKINEYLNDLTDISQDDSGKYSSEDYDKAVNKYNGSKTGTIVSGILGGVGLVGFGISFAF